LVFRGSALQIAIAELAVFSLKFLRDKINLRSRPFASTILNTRIADVNFASQAAQARLPGARSSIVTNGENNREVEVKGAF
jgi:hypothetical protein